MVAGGGRGKWAESGVRVKQMKPGMEDEMRTEQAPERLTKCTGACERENPGTDGLEAHQHDALNMSFRLGFFQCLAAILEDI